MSSRHIELVDAFVRDVTEATARELETMADKARATTINEQKYLQPSAAKAARALAESIEPRPVVSTQFKLIFDEWPRLGSVDLAVTWPGENAVLLELKCGTGKDSFGPCVWDAAKLGFALLRGQATAAYLLAGAPAASWSKPIRGCELFAEDRWSVAEYRQAYADWWRHWEKRGDPLPSMLPDQIETSQVAAVPFAVAGTPWELRVSRVETPRELAPWPAFLEP